MRKAFPALTFVAAMIVVPPLPAAPVASASAKIHRMDVVTRPITRFRINSDQTRFGALVFAGGLEMHATSDHFGALSGLAFTEGQTGLAAVADTGFWLTATLQRDEANRPIGLTGVTMTEITGPGGAPFAGKWLTDAEAIAVDGETVLVSFEREHRIARYARRDDGLRWRGEMPPPVPTDRLSHNAGFEGIAIGPPGSALAGALIGVSENGLDGSADIIGFVQPATGPAFRFAVRRRGAYRVTDLAILPGGDLVLLERRFALHTGLAMRLRRIDNDAVTSDATVDGEVLLEADMNHQIDNMEGLAITTDPDGVPRLTIVSDDNHALLQRNLLIEFRLVGPAVSPPPAADG